MESPQVAGSMAATLCEAFVRTTSRWPDEPALAVLDGPTLSWREYQRLAEHLAGGLRARGVGRGRTVATVLVNRPEFFLVDTATLLAGGTPLAIYNTSPAHEMAHILDNAEVRVVVTEQRYAPVVTRAAQLAAVNLDIVILGADHLAGLDALRGCDPVAAEDADARPDDVALIIYTSGTTGVPKGVQLTHANLTAAWRMMLAAEPRMAEVRRVVSYLPPAHLADRTFSYYPALHTGAAISCLADPRDLGAALPRIRPSTLLGVPRVWEKLRSALLSGVPAGSRPDDPDVASTLRQRIGLDEQPVLWAGAAPLDIEQIEFFDSIGLPILEGYGMSETSAVIATNRMGRRRNGTVGTALPGIEIKIAEDGEILVRGPVVMRGYRNMPKQTAEALDSVGWLHTGDVGELDQDGYLTIVDRKKELIINSAGKNMSPAQIENAVRTATPLAGPVAAIGDRRPYVTALLTLDPDEVKAWAATRDLPTDLAHLAARRELRAHFEEAVERANERLARVARIRRFTILPDPWTPGAGLVTPTMKLKRKAIAERFAAEIEELYR